MSVHRRLAPESPLPAAVLIVAHGSSRSAGAFASAEAHAARLRADGGFSAVATGFLRGAQSPREALETLPPGDVVVLPLLMSDGYFSRVQIPSDLGLGGPVSRVGHWRVSYAEPVGLDPGIADILSDAALAECRALGCAAAATDILVVGHGSPKDDGSRRATLDQAARLEGFGRFRAVTCAFLDEPPHLADWMAALPAQGAPVVVTGLFAADGLHAGLDIPALVAQWREGAGPEARPLAYAGAVGSRPAVTDLLRAAVRRSLARLPLEAQPS